MSIVITQSMILTSDGSMSVYDEQRLNGPIVGWENLVRFDGILADSEDEDHQAVNLANPSTHLFWRSGEVGVQSIIFSFGDLLPIDYVALAKHNLGSTATVITLESRMGGGDDWALVTGEFILSNDNPTIVRFPKRDASELRLTLGEGTDIPEISVLYIGQLLQLQRNIYVGHTPINYGRKVTVANGRSESGNFLGRVVTGRTKQSSIQLSNLTADWYRLRMDPFVKSAEERPFFFAWRPDGYPKEVGYVWSTDDVIPVNQLPNGMMQINMSIAGIAGDGDTVVTGG